MYIVIKNKKLKIYNIKGGQNMADYSKFENVKVNVEDGLGWVTLNRPEKRNAMSPDLHWDMD